MNTGLQYVLKANLFTWMGSRWLLCSLILIALFLAGGCLAGDLPQEGELMNRLRSQSTSIRGEKLQVSLVLRAIGRKAGVNVLVDESINDTMSLDLVKVSLYDLFQLILETKALRAYETNQALVVEKAADYKKDLKDVVTTRLCPKYGKIDSHLKELTVLKSTDGSLTASGDGNCIVVHDHLENADKIAALLGQLDKPTPQVHIKARIVSIDKSVSKDLGIKWGYTDLSKLPDDNLTAAADLSVASATSSVVFGFIRDTYTLDLELSALQQRNQLKVLSEPRIVVLDGEEAEIKQGQEIPYESGTQENRNTSFREAVLGLKVIPKILQDKLIRLNVKVTNDSVSDQSTEDGQPLLNRQEIKTNLFLQDGITVVVGGILSKSLDQTKDEIPWFSEIPLIGWMFRNTSDMDSSYELLVFLTPTLLNQEKETDLSGQAAGQTSSASGKFLNSQLMTVHPLQVIGNSR